MTNITDQTTCGCRMTEKRSCTGSSFDSGVSQSFLAPLALARDPPVGPGAGTIGAPGGLRTSGAPSSGAPEMLQAPGGSSRSKGCDEYEVQLGSEVLKLFDQHDETEKTMDTTLLDSMVTQTREVADWVEDVAPTTTVPTCPGWTLTDLVGHIGSTQRWMNRLVADGITDPGAAFALGWEEPPAEPSAWSQWLVDGAQEARATFSSAPGDQQVFDPSGGGDGVAFWGQRLFGEISVHRIDAAATLGRRYTIDTASAVAAIEDWLGNMASSGWAQNVPGFADAMRGDGQTIAWVADDADQAWLLRRTDVPLVLTHDRIEADVTIQGPAQELLEIVSRRRPLEAAELSSVQGDRDELVHLIEHMVWIGAV